jgi:hypothetical protein
MTEGCFTGHGMAIKPALGNPLPAPSRSRRVARNLNLKRRRAPGSGLPGLDVRKIKYSMSALLTFFTSAYGALMLVALTYSVLSSRNIDLGTIGLDIFPLVSALYAIIRGVSAPNQLPSLRSHSERTKFSLTIAFGAMCAIGISKMGMVAGVGALLSICVGTFYSILVGGQFRAFYAAIFGSTLLVIILLILDVQLHARMSLLEYLAHFGIFVIVPTIVSQMVTWWIAPAPGKQSQSNTSGGISSLKD